MHQKEKTQILRTNITHSMHQKAKTQIPFLSRKLLDLLALRATIGKPKQGIKSKENGPLFVSTHGGKRSKISIK